jgi:citrate synthase
MGMLDLLDRGAFDVLQGIAKNLDDRDILYKQIVRLIAKMPTLAAAAHRFSVGMPFVYPDNNLSYPENFASMMWKVQPTYEPNPVLVKALDVLFILHADHEQNCGTTAMRVVGSSHSVTRTRDRRRHGGALRTSTRGRERSGPENAQQDRAHRQYPGLHRYRQGRARPCSRDSVIASTRTSIRAPRSSRRRPTMSSQVTGKNPLFDIALKLEEIALADDYFISRRLYPNVDFYSGLIYQAMGFRSKCSRYCSRFREPRGGSRTIKELLAQDVKIARPRQLYIGSDVRDFVPMSER